MFCTVCKKCCHQRCLGLRNIRGMQNIVCPTCEQAGGDGNDRKEEEDIGIEVNDGVLEELE